MHSKLFRTLLLASLVVAVAGALVDVVFPSLIPEPIRAAQEAVDAELSNAFVFGSLVLIAILLVAIVASYIGLYQFRSWGRRAALWTTLAALVASPFLGAWAQSGTALALLELSSSLWGAVLASAYYSPVATEFEPGDASQETPSK